MAPVGGGLQREAQGAQRPEPVVAKAHGADGRRRVDAVPRVALGDEASGAAQLGGEDGKKDVAGAAFCGVGELSD